MDHRLDSIQKQNQNKLQQALDDVKSRGKVEFMDLWVRAGHDGIRNGADPICQQIFMVLLRKSLESPTGQCQFNVKTVNPNKPHLEFKDAGLRNVPAVVLKEDINEHVDDILEFLDSKFPQPTLQYFDPDAEDASTDLFSKFCWFIKEVNKDPKQLEQELRRIDAYLGENDTRYLTGNVITHLDCRIMPVLHHIRIACKHLKGYEVPKQFVHLAKYYKNMYDSKIFRKSAPCDQEIILYWAERKDTPDLPIEKVTELGRQEPRFSFKLD